MSRRELEEAVRSILEQAVPDAEPSSTGSSSGGVFGGVDPDDLLTSMQSFLQQVGVSYPSDLDAMDDMDMDPSMVLDEVLADLRQAGYDSIHVRDSDGMGGAVMVVPKGGTLPSPEELCQRLNSEWGEGWDLEP